MESIAKLNYTSKPTLVRFAKTLGYSGWKEFIYAFSHETINLNRNAYVDIDPNFPFSKTDDTMQIIENITNLLIQSIKDTVSLIDVDQLNQAAKILDQANRIVIYGTSPNCTTVKILSVSFLQLANKQCLHRLEKQELPLNF